MGLELRKSASFILSGGSSATPAVAASAELLMGAAIAISYRMDKIDRCAAPQCQRQCGSTRAAAKPAKCSRSYVGSRMCPHKLLRSMRTRGGQPQTAPLASLTTWYNKPRHGVCLACIVTWECMCSLLII